MALCADSALALLENATISFEGNLAENKGGGLFVKEVGEIIDVNAECFVSVNNVGSVSLYFSNNSAKTAGNDWYGGNQYCDIYSNMAGDYVCGWKVITEIVIIPDNYTMDLTCNPCMCVIAPLKAAKIVLILFTV